MSTTQVDAPARSGPPVPSSARGGLRAFADRWPFRRKLNLLVGIPLSVIAVLLTYLIVDLVSASERALGAAEVVRDSRHVAQLVADLQAEHRQAILLSVRHEAAFDGGTPSTDAYRQAQLTVDAQVKKVADEFGGGLPDTEARALREVEGLSSLRQTVEQGYLPADNIDPAYNGAVDGLIDGLDLDHTGALTATSTSDVLDSLLRADAAHGAFETSVFSARTGDTNALIEYTGAVGSHEQFDYQAERFGRFASDAQSQEFGGIEHNSSQAAISQYYAELAVDPSALQVDSQAEKRASFRAALASYPDFSAQASTRLKITTSLIGQIAVRAEDTSTKAEWRAGVLFNVGLFGFALWIAFAILVRRSVLRPVLALTRVAQDVADVAGRELARVADDDAEEARSPRLRELPVTADDEIGELAEAFNNVQSTAAALLERQVLSRRNVAEMFGNVGRRVSNLTTRQIALIDAVERGETDPALLARLYSIDHIAVRLRRNADSLMLLAGIRETVMDSGPTELTNVVRAALGQIEGYQRVQLHVSAETMVEPDIVGDLTLMIAELLENAVSFSPAGSPVDVRIGADHEGATITVSDYGLGMSPERLAEENARLVRRERLDLVPTKVLGLFVVGALARRWRIDVFLSRTPGGGVTSEVRIPSALLLTLAGVDPTLGALPGTKTAPPVAPVAPVTPGTRVAGGPLPPLAAPTAPSAPVGGPSRASSVPAAGSPATAEDQAGLPRRVPRRDQPAPAPQPAAQPAGDTTVPGPIGFLPLPREQAGTARTRDHDSAGSAPNGSRTAAERPAHSRVSEPPVPPRRTGTAQPQPQTHPQASAVGRLPSTGDSRLPTVDRPQPADDGARPLRRRVKGATLRTTVDTAADRAARQPARPADADEVREELEEFEAAVQRAHRDTGGDTGEHPYTYDRRPYTHDRPPAQDTHDGHHRPVEDDDRTLPHRQNHLPEGAEQ